MTAFVLCLGAELSEKAKNEFQEAQSSLRYDYLNSINETITDVSVLRLLSLPFSQQVFLFQITSYGGHLDDARGYVHDGLDYVDTYEPLWYMQTCMYV